MPRFCIGLASIMVAAALLPASSALATDARTAIQL